MGRYSDADTAEVLGSRRKLYEYPGIFAFEIAAISDGETESDGQPFFSVDFRVADSNNSELPIGSFVTWTCKRHAAKAYQKYFLSDIKKFLGAVTGVQPEAVGSSAIEQATSEDQPCAGASVGAEVFTRLKKDGEPFVATRFFRIES